MYQATSLIGWPLVSAPGYEYVCTLNRISLHDSLLSVNPSVSNAPLTRMHERLKQISFCSRIHRPGQRNRFLQQSVSTRRSWCAVHCPVSNKREATHRGTMPRVVRAFASVRQLRIVHSYQQDSCSQFTRCLHDLEVSVLA